MPDLTSILAPPFEIPGFTDIESVIFEWVTTDTELQALISGRFYYLELPQKEELPAIVYERLATEYFETLQETIPLRRPTFQFTIWAVSFAEVKEISEILKERLNDMFGIWGNIRVEWSGPIDESGIDDLEENEALKRQGRRIDYEIWYQKLL